MRVRRPTMLCSLLLCYPSLRASLPHCWENFRTNSAVSSILLAMHPHGKHSQIIFYHLDYPHKTVHHWTWPNLTSSWSLKPSHSASLDVSSIFINTYYSLTLCLTEWPLTCLSGSPRGPYSHSLPLNEGCFSPNPTYHRICHILLILTPSFYHTPSSSKPNHMNFSSSMELYEGLWATHLHSLKILAPGSLSLTSTSPVIMLGDFQIHVEDPSPILTSHLLDLSLSFSLPEPPIDPALVSNHTLWNFNVKVFSLWLILSICPAHAL